MEYTTFKGIDKKVSKFFMGTFLMFYADREKHFTTLDAAYDLGITAFDTARAYDSEDTVGAWINSRGIRENVVLLSKGCHPDNGVERVTPEAIDADLKLSLEALDTDYLDIYQLHIIFVLISTGGELDRLEPLIHNLALQRHVIAFMQS